MYRDRMPNSDLFKWAVKKGRVKKGMPLTRTSAIIYKNEDFTPPLIC